MIDFENREIFERPGCVEVERSRGESASALEAMDSPADHIADVLSAQIASYRGKLPATVTELQQFCTSQFRASLTPTAVSAWIEDFVEAECVQRVSAACHRMLSVIRAQKRPAMACDALACALGIHLGEDKTMVQIARRHGVTKQAFSKRCIEFCDFLGLDPSPLMRPEGTRESYKRKQLQRHSAARAAGQGEGSITDLRSRLRAAREHHTGAELRAIA